FPPRRSSDLGRSRRVGLAAPERRVGSWLADLRADVEELGEERQFEGALEERDARRAAGAALEADRPLNGPHVPETPELELVLDVDELLAHLIGVPVLVGGFVDLLEDRNQPFVALVGLGPVPRQARLGYGEAAAVKV